MPFLRRHKVLLSLLAIGLAGLLTRLSLRPGVASLTISTATQGGTYAVLGQQLGRIVEDLPEQPIETVTVLPSGGSNENLRRLLDGEVDSECSLISTPIHCN